MILSWNKSKQLQNSEHFYPGNKCKIINIFSFSTFIVNTRLFLMFSSKLGIESKVVCLLVPTETDKWLVLVF